MQRFRRSALMLVATGSVALAAACGSGSSKTVTVSSPGGSTVSSSSKVLTGAGSTLVYPLVSQWEPDYSSSAGVTITYGAIGSGGGIDQITARAVDFGASDAPLTARPGHGLQGLPADPVGAGCDDRRIQRQGCARSSPPDRAGARRHLPGEHHDLERCQDQGAQLGRQPALHQDHPDLPQRRLGRQLRLLELPVGRQPELQEQDRRLDAAALLRRHRRREELRCRGVHPEHRRSDRLRRALLHRSRRPARRTDPERGRAVPGAGCPEHQGGCECRHDRQSRRFDHTGEPARLGDGCVSRCPPTPTRSCRSRRRRPQR